MAIAKKSKMEGITMLVKINGIETEITTEEYISHLESKNTLLEKTVSEIKSIPVAKLDRQGIVSKVVVDLITAGKTVILWSDLLEGCFKLGFNNRQEILTIASQQKSCSVFYLSLSNTSVSFHLPARKDI